MLFRSDFIHRRKRSGHLISKGRLFGAQFVGWLEDNHWLKLAKHANRQAQQLAETLAAYSSIHHVWPCQANEIFLIMPAQLAEKLSAAGAEFYQWPVNALPAGTALSNSNVFVRLVTSFASSDEHISEFCEIIRTY